MLGIYIHVPFCTKICDYCDFRVMPSSPKLYSEYVDLLIGEIRGFEALHPGALASAETLYLGGGTPSLLPQDCLRRIFSALGDFGVDVSRLREVSMEFNPESCLESTVDAAFELGVGRISLGLQSFHADILSRIGRHHSVREAFRALELLVNRGDVEVNGDLMFDLPGQSVADFLEDLSVLSDYPLNHVSFYGLTVSRRTRLGSRIARGELKVDEDLYEDMYLQGVDMLESKGFERYEVSNFCRSGKRSLHNCNYWDRGEYLGFGPGAHAFFKGLRFNAPALYPRWREFVRSGMPDSLYEKDSLSPEDVRTELVWLSLRQSKGLDLPEFCKKFGNINASSYAKWVEKGYLVLDNDMLRLAGKGWIFMDSIVADILNGYIPNCNNS